MRNRILFSILMAIWPLFGFAQFDDMYFNPTKKAEKETKVSSPKSVPASESYTRLTREDNRMEATRDVDEYNRRYRYEESLDVSPEEEEFAEPEDSLDGRWVNDFQGSDADYQYAKRILRFRTPSVGIAVSSPLYWDLCYGPDAIYWNVYDDGFYAYAFPSSWNSWYYGPSFSYTWGWYSPHYWGWGYRPWYHGWYDPWWPGYGGCWHHHHHHYPYWGGHHGVGSGRPVVRPSVRYREGSSLPRTASRTDRSSRPSLNRTFTGTRVTPTRSSGTPVRSSSTPIRSGRTGTTRTPVRSSGTTSRPTRSSVGPTRSSQPSRSTVVSQPSRSSNYTPSPSRSSSPSFGTPSRSSGGGRSRGMSRSMPSRSGRR